MAASWAQYRAQEELVKVTEKYNIDLTLFHGRGGAAGRGGAPIRQAILSQPPNTIKRGMRVTEQGEMIRFKYGSSLLAQNSMDLILSAAIEANLMPSPQPRENWRNLMDRLTDIAMQEYRNTVKDGSHFADYFRASTPEQELSLLALGSRPTRRVADSNTISDLRAIPWVFAWTQTRTSIPSWYGVGTGFDQWIGVNQPGERLHELREMYRDWPFFRSLMNNIHVGLGRADLDIAELYSELVQDEEGRQIFSCLRREFERACSTVLRITERDEVLDTEKWLQHSIRMRNPYVDPMNYIQVALLERFRQSDDKDERDRLQDVILHSINGIAAGLQSVG